MRLIASILLLSLSGCIGRSDYQKPIVTEIPDKFAEGNVKWQEAKPNAHIDRGEWWKIYNDPILNDLENQLNQHNQNIVAAQHSYQAALALVEQARGSYLPNIAVSENITRQRALKNNKSTISSSHASGVSASWELDLWGNISASLQANLAAAGASNANWASVKLSMQSSLAQYYFQFRMADEDQKYLDAITNTNKEILIYTQNHYKAGIANQLDINNAENNYQAAQSASSQNSATRAQYQHAIATLVGKPASSFHLASATQNEDSLISIPIMLPSLLLERRPDIAQAERMVAQANANIGIAKSAFFPSLSLGASINMQGNGLGRLFSAPTLTWSLGPELAMTLFNGGANIAQLKYVKESYQSSIASYRQTVLAAFADVEDQLVSLKNLEKQLILQKQSTKNADKSLKIARNQYNAGIVDHLSVLNAEITAYNLNKIKADTIGSKRVAEINLIKALGGGWKN